MTDLNKTFLVEISEVRFVANGELGSDVFVYLISKPTIYGADIAPVGFNGWRWKGFAPGIGVMEILDIHFADHINWTRIYLTRDCKTSALVDKVDVATIIKP